MNSHISLWLSEFQMPELQYITLKSGKQDMYTVYSKFVTSTIPVPVLIRKILGTTYNILYIQYIHILHILYLLFSYAYSRVISWLCVCLDPYIKVIYV